MTHAVLRPLKQVTLQLYLCVWMIAVGWAQVAHAAGPYGTDNGWAIDDSGNPLLTSSLASKLCQGETGWIRIEMRLIPGHTNWDAAMLGYYDTAVNNACNAGLQVLLLIDGGSWPGSQTNWEANASETNPGLNGDNIYVEQFATNAVVPIVQHFHNRVKVYELWNEPNSWTVSVGVGGTYLYPSNYGWLLARSWEAIHKTYNINDVTLFFGGVFGHNIGGVTSYGNAGAQYIDDTYSTGTNTSTGDSFAYIYSKYGVYPLDGVGEHVYLSSGGTVSATTFRQYEDWVRQAYTKYEGASTAKKTFITEFGWQTPTSGNPSQALQDTNLITAFTTIQATPYVQMAIWFQFEDNPAGDLYYGVLNSSDAPKLSYPDYQHFERFEGINPDGTTNTAIMNYFTAHGQAQLGNPRDNGHGAWVYAFLNGQAQDFAGGAHSNATVMTSASGTFELNDLYGMWSFYMANLGTANYGTFLDNEFAVGGGTRQDFSQGHLSWDSTNLVVWHALPPVPVGITAVASNAQVSLQWNAVTNVSAYNVKRSTTNGGPYAVIAAGVAATNYVDAPVTNGMNYFYVITATNINGESGNSAQVSALPVGPPTITAQPLSLVVNQGDSASFNVSVTSAVACSYQWQFGGSNIIGATTNVYKLTNVLPAAAGSYSVVAANYGGTTLSSNALLTIRPILSVGTTAGGGKVVINWTGSYNLQSATNVLGPYGDITGATSPFTNTNTIPQQFFRLKN